MPSSIADFATLRSGRCSARAFNFTQPCCFAFEAAKVEELGPPYLVGADYFNLGEHFGIQGEDALDALAEADLADGDACLRSITPGNHCTFEGLDTFLVAFFNLD